MYYKPYSGSRESNRINIETKKKLGGRLKILNTSRTAKGEQNVPCPQIFKIPLHKNNSAKIQ